MTPTDTDPVPPLLHWQEDGQPRSARWQSAAGVAPPRRVVLADDTLNADAALRLAREGTALLWRGDFHNARQLLQALVRRVDRRPRRAPPGPPAGAAPDPQAFHRHRMAQGQRARLLGQLLVPLDEAYRLPLRRAPDVAAACTAAWGPGTGPLVVSLRELAGVTGAWEWQRQGVPVAALGGATIHPRYGVFSPVRGEYLDLVAQAPLPPAARRPGAVAMDIGVGTGVLSALLARRGVPQLVATDLDPRALDCARDNLARLGLVDRVQLCRADLYPPAAAVPGGRVALVVCNPPWLPGRPASPVEHAVYDPDSRMLRGFLAGLAPRLLPGGEGWLILSDLAEHLGLRAPGQLAQWVEAAGLRVAGRLDIRARHPKAADREDPLHAARAAETTSLWRLVALPGTNGPAARAA